MSLDEALNRLPFHVMCRCTYVAVTKDNKLVTSRDFEGAKKQGAKKLRADIVRLKTGQPEIAFIQHDTRTNIWVANEVSNVEKVIAMYDDVMERHPDFQKPTGVCFTENKYITDYYAAYDPNEDRLFIMSMVTNDKIYERIS